jgi:hypothetical protein
LQVKPPLQVAHAAPAVPQAAFVLPVRQTFPEQQPVGQLKTLHGVVH